MTSCLLIRQGSMVVAVSKDLERAHLGVPGAFVFWDLISRDCMQLVPSDRQPVPAHADALRQL